MLNKLLIVVCDQKLSSGLDDSATKSLAVEPIVTPNGCVFCGPGVRQGVLPLMLREILATRFMVKQAMKDANKLTAEGR